MNYEGILHDLLYLYLSKTKYTPHPTTSLATTTNNTGINYRIHQNHWFRGKKKPGYAAKQKVCVLGQPLSERRETRISHEKITNDISNIANVIYANKLALKK